MSQFVTYQDWDEVEVRQLEKKFTDTLDVLKWTYANYSGDQVVYACSFGAEAIVLLDHIAKVYPQARVVFLDTSLHFQETYDTIDKIKKQYPSLQIHQEKPALSLKEQAEIHGEELWKRDPDLCCHIRKVVPLEKVLQPVTAWISGLRWEQSEERRGLHYLNKDERFKKVKICPLIHWTWEEIWQYISLHQLVYNPLHDQGYPSIGCEVCTLPAKDPQDLRSGRWANFTKRECGLHTFRKT